MENQWSGLNYHHSRPLDEVRYGPVTQSRVILDEFDAVEIKSYDWLARYVGFFPLFLAVGDSDESIRSTGWQNQWRRKSNEVLFSFRDIENKAFLDSDYWVIVPGNFANGFYDISEYTRRLILKPSWKKSDWLRTARRDGGRVEAVVPELDLRTADLISVRNKTTQQLMENQGFKNVQVTRIRVKS